MNNLDGTLLGVLFIIAICYFLALVVAIVWLIYKSSTRESKSS